MRGREGRREGGGEGGRRGEEREGEGGGGGGGRGEEREEGGGRRGRREGGERGEGERGHRGRDKEAYKFHIFPRVFQSLHCLIVCHTLQIRVVHRDNLVTESTCT